MSSASSTLETSSISLGIPRDMIIVLVCSTPRLVDIIGSMGKLVKIIVVIVSSVHNWLCLY